MSGDWRSREPPILQTIPANAAQADARAKRPSGGEPASWYTVGNRLVDRVDRGMLQPLDLVLDHQLASLQLDNLQVVCGKVHERFVQFIFENLVFTFKFNKMRL